jgi:hypothetical protein
MPAAIAVRIPMARRLLVDDRMKTQLASSLVVLLFPAANAVAQPTYAGGDDDDDVNTNVYAQNPDTGIGFALGGGVSGFTNDVMRDTTGDGGAWDARLTLGLRSPLALELSYIGSAQTIDALGIDDDALLVGNGAQAAVRFNALSGYTATPFLFGGIAWRHYDITRTDTNTSALTDNDDVYEVPVGLGVSTQTRGLMIDLRGEFRYVADADLAPGVTSDAEDVDESLDDPAAMHRWGVNLTVGIAL